MNELRVGDGLSGMAMVWFNGGLEDYTVEQVVNFALLHSMRFFATARDCPHHRNNAHAGCANP